MPEVEFGAAEFEHYRNIATIMAHALGFVKLLPLDDCVGYAMAAVAKALPKYDPAKCDKIEPWLVMKMRWAILDGIRSEKLVQRANERRPTRTVLEKSVDREFLDLIGVDHVSPADAERETIEAQKRILDRLPEELRGVVQLRLFDGLSYRDTLKALGISFKEISARLARARKILQADDYTDSGT